MPTQQPSPKFSYLAYHDARLVALATQAEEHFANDPPTSLAELRLSADALAKHAAADAASDKEAKERLAAEERAVKAGEDAAIWEALAISALLRASHMRPWADCETDAEWLDVYNGILLAPHLDRAFITVQDDDAIIVSDALDADASTVHGLDQPLRVRGLAEGHRGYLPWHCERVFQREQEGTP